MKLLRAYKTELDPNNVQHTQFLRHAGAARVAYNWGLGRKIAEYKATGKSPSAIDLHRELVRLKDVPKEEGGFPWMREVSKCAPQEALRNLDRAYSSFFSRCKKGAKRKGFPKFKSKKNGVGGFRFSSPVRVSQSHIRLPKIGWVRLRERGYLPMDYKILSTTVKEQAGRWFVSVLIEQEVPDPVPATQAVIGVDVGVKSLAVTSDGRTFENPHSLTRLSARLRLAAKSVSRRQKGSRNRKKAVRRLARVHYRIGNVRRDALHKASSAIVKSAGTVVLETLNVSGMMQNHKLARSVADASMAELHRQIEYKAKWRGVTVVKADRFFSSTKTCSSCGQVKDQMSLAERTYECGACGLVMDRDWNAARNLMNLAVSSTVSACRPGGSDGSFTGSVKLLVGQEPNIIQE